jgi:bifunctional N-acetylglucosamine-1-phosphate-uridyltransferase/glucosamine-1-phosphate-acetyltransferase GlmU-like protein
MLTVALWPTSSPFAARELLGVPVWRRTLAAAQELKARRALWLGSPPGGNGTGVEAVDPQELSRVRDTVLVLAAELPCVTPSSLRDLVGRGRKRPVLLVPQRPERPVAAFAAPGPEMKKALAPFRGRSRLSVSEVLRNLAPALAFASDENDLLLVDDPESFTRAARVLRERKVLSLLRRGVVIPDPGSVLVDPEVSVARGAKLLPWVHLEGRTVVGRDAVISSFTHVVDTEIGAGSVVLDHCFLRSSRIGKRVQIGPFAHLRPDSDVGPDAKVGNFVELKNARLGAGAKAPHLSYLGDATIGRGSNVGAGTITCNYDGTKKHRTVVGDGAFIGSDVQLVAPVRVGKGAYVAAGSCIVEDVPAHALAIARSRQTVKRGWAKSRASARRARRRS